ncbi:hypothetical protein THAOC_27168 [Thalassiosira oceanica]|uniref:MORN repeat-containing protein 5 n=1 Tax=Thalassiosira oceanica TaxID=159749 RepID=K0S3C3_THAOC|nr:hypothetical protein THAOC_27168 [Thalassiosira oceanica]|eukprot:EJK53407.1 hypothetical protein THAOC_27168 [Thalassiosira oceanica]
MHPVDPVRSREHFDREPGSAGSGANAVADVIPTTVTSQQIQKKRVPLVSQSQGDVRKPGPDADDQDSKALPIQLSSSDASTSLVAVDTAPKQPDPGWPGRPKKKKRGPKPKEVPGSTAASQDTQSGSGGDTSDTRTGTATYETQKARGQGHPPQGSNVAEQQEAWEEANRNAVEDMDVDLAASQLESADLSEQDQTKKSVSFCKLQHTSSANNQPMSYVAARPSIRTRTTTAASGSTSRPPPEAHGCSRQRLRCIFRGPVVGGKAHGEGTLEWTNGEVYKGGFKDGYRTGKGEVTTSGGNVFVGHFHEGYMTGEGKVTYTDGGSFEGRFHRGQKVYGKWTFRGRIYGRVRGTLLKGG